MTLNGNDPATWLMLLVFLGIALFIEVRLMRRQQAAILAILQEQHIAATAEHVEKAGQLSAQDRQVLP